MNDSTRNLIDCLRYCTGMDSSKVSCSECVGHLRVRSNADTRLSELGCQDFLMGSAAAELERLANRVDDLNCHNLVSVAEHEDTIRAADNVIEKLKAERNELAKQLMHESSVNNTGFHQLQASTLARMNKLAQEMSGCIAELTVSSANQYQRLAMRTCSFDLNAADRTDMTHHAVFGLTAEAGEIAGLFQKAYQGHALDREHAKKELGDVMWMVAELCTAMNFELEDVMRTNIEKLKARYPDGFDPEKSLHRKEGDV